MNPEDYPGTGDLPDKLAFVKPSRARAYIALQDADRPLTADDLTDRLDCSKPTAYRCVNDLEELGLATDAVRLPAAGRPKTAYTTTDRETTDAESDPVWKRARTDGGTDQ